MLDPRMSQAPAGFDPNRDLPKGFWPFFLDLHREFTPRQQEILARRRQFLAEAHAGKLPEHRRGSEAQSTEWTVDLPQWVRDQRNQMTGPADDGELSVKLLNSGSPGVMLDLEDSQANFYTNTLQGIDNCVKGLYGELSYFDKKRNAEVGIKDPSSATVIFVRPRGLHLSQAGVLPGEELVSASLFDVALLTFKLDLSRLKHNLSFYIPKTEFAEEAQWWRDLFVRLAEFKGQAQSYIKCMALVESHPFPYQMEEFAYILREHIMGLNLGRWDYMASLIHFNLNNPAWVLPDRNTIPSDVPFFQRVRELQVEICHKHGFMAIGGMTALYPSRTDAELDARAKEVLARDKKNEASCGFDGAWTGHPDQNEIAVAQFPAPNQLSFRKPAFERFPDLRPTPAGVGKHTLSGTRAAVRTVIRYRNGVLNGKGASLLDGYMEDLATDRIYRLMIAQRIKHRDAVTILGDDDKPVAHTPQFVAQLFEEELARLLGELGPEADEATRQKFVQAKEQSWQMIQNGWFDPV